VSRLNIKVRYHRERRFKPGARLMRQGHPSQEVFVITTGECEVVVVAADDDEEKEKKQASEAAAVDGSNPQKQRYMCQACEDDYSQWHDQCPGCKTWESFRALTPDEEEEKEASGEASEEQPSQPQHPRKSTSVTWGMLGRRRKGNLVGEIPHAPHDSTSTAASSVSSATTTTTPGAPVPRHAPFPPSAVTVIAKTEVRALVFDRADVEWAAGHDYRLSSEFERALRERRRLLAKQSRLAARAERERSAEGGGQRAASEVVRRRD
jgi:CRP-like cAMP-binding protein